MTTLMTTLYLQSTTQIHSQKVNYQSFAKSRVRSLDNITHVPSGGDVKVDIDKILTNHIVYILFQSEFTHDVNTCIQHFVHL